MSGILQHTKREIRLNGQKVQREYNAEIATTIRSDDKTTTTKLAMYFSLIFLGSQNGKLNYLLEVDKRFFLDDINFIVKKTTKAQQLASKVATLNDRLIFEVSPNFKLLSIVNTEEILKKWKKIKQEIQAEFVDLDDLINDFDWQLQNNIQQPFVNDNFYNFFFANIFYKEFENDKPILENKSITNAIGNLDMPIVEQKEIIKKNIVFSAITIQTEAKLAIGNKKFPLEKLNVFLGDLAEKNTELDLNFSYNGSYKVIPPKGLITNGELTYSFEIGDVYKKTTNINFNLIEDEQ